MKKILHISNWYPNKWDNLQGIFIKEQFKVFSEVTHSHMINVQVRQGESLLSYEYIKYSNTEEGYYFFTKIKSNKIIELLTTFLLLWALIKSDYKKYDLLHVHIAYPLLIHYFLWKKIIKIPVIISEHWSAYHFNFHMPKDTNKLDSIKRIFRQDIPLITVSESLKQDIENFSDIKNNHSIVIPNIININNFNNNYTHNSIPTFFILNIWTKIKNPFPLLEGFSNLDKQGVAFHLKIGGYGDLLDDMKKYIKKNNFEDRVSFLGKMDKSQISQEYVNSDAYLYSSKYETFSVVCAEALCCGTPLIGPKISAILEYTKPEDITIVNENNADSWVSAINSFIEKKDNYNKKEISKYYSQYFSNEKIQQKYLDFIKKSLI
jgi:glycosyltransferase involved in cell wall biosynthesis